MKIDFSSFFVLFAIHVGQIIVRSETISISCKTVVGFVGRSCHMFLIVNTFWSTGRRRGHPGTRWHDCVKDLGLDLEFYLTFTSCRRRFGIRRLEILTCVSSACATP